MTSPDVALVHDYATQRGGAERVALELARVFPGAPLHMALYQPSTTHDAFAEVKVLPSAINRFGVLRRDHRRAFPVLAAVMSATRIDARVTVCSSSGWAHGVRVTGRKVVYCHSPARWLYQADRAFGGGQAAMRLVSAPYRRALRHWDQRAAGSAHRYLANSTTTARRIAETYGIEAEVIHPPPAVGPGVTHPVAGVEPGFLLCVSRLQPYKHVDRVMAAAAKIDAPLVVVGDGPMFGALQRSTDQRRRILTSVSDAELRWLFQHCGALVALSHEDFGLTPIEAATFGRPTVALRSGGYLDTVEEGVNGIFVESIEPARVEGALRDALAATWDEAAIRASAERFGQDRFAEQLRSVIDDELGRAR